AIAEELAQVQRLFLRVGDADFVARAELPPALLAIARGQVDGHARAALLRRVGEALGDDGLLEGAPAGPHLLAGGHAAGARASLERALALTRRARFVALLADATRSRALYLEALLLNPRDVAFERIADAEVRALPDVARDELGLEVDWTAAVGAVTGV